jgi:large subunit ribosomal protein L29
MKVEEIRSKTDSELDYDLENMKRELFDLRFKSSTESLTSPARIRLLRRSIARIQTILHERAADIRAEESR